MADDRSSLRGQVGIVTGGGRGIGQAMALALARSGMHVIAAARSAWEIEETAGLARSAGGSAEAAVLDVCDEESIETCLAGVLKRHGRIDLLVNNAGSQSAVGPVWEVDPRRWRQDIEVNLLGPFLCCRAVLPSMMQRRSGRIINVLGGGLTGPIPYNSAYSSSKAGLARFTETLSIEAGPWSVHVFALSPGAVQTNLTRSLFDSPEGRKWQAALKARVDSIWIGPERAADRTVLLASGQADGLSGLLLTVDDDVTAMLKSVADIRRNDLHALRVVKANEGHVRPILSPPVGPDD